MRAIQEKPKSESKPHPVPVRFTDWASI